MTHHVPLRRHVWRRLTALAAVAWALAITLSCTEPTAPLTNGPQIAGIGRTAATAADRLAAIACLAFLPATRGNQRLRRIAIDDPEPGVRQAALWAYGFAGGADAENLLSERARDDRDARVRRFAQTGRDGHRRSWWAD